MWRNLFFLVLVAFCVFQTNASEGSRLVKAVKRAIDDAKVVPLDLVDDLDSFEDEEEDDEEDEVDERDMDEDEDEEDEEYEDDDEGLEGKLPEHPINGVTNPAFMEIIARSRRPACSNRKCLRWYNGRWKGECTNPNTRAVAYCSKTDKWCCAPCKIKKWCEAKGGFCTLKNTCRNRYPEATLQKKGCFGKWVCCIP